METKKDSQKIKHFIHSSEQGTIFTNSDFYGITNQGNVKVILSRLVDEGLLTRLMDGFYVVLHFNTSINEYILPSPNQMAKKIAQKFQWTITPASSTALNLIGLSTQVPSRYIFASDGPYRIYTYQNLEIEFKHISSRYIKSFSPELAILVQGLRAMGKDALTDQDRIVLNRYFHKYVKDEIEKNTTSLPAWIYEELIQMERKQENQ